MIDLQYFQIAGTLVHKRKNMFYCFALHDRAEIGSGAFEINERLFCLPEGVDHNHKHPSEESGTMSHASPSRRVAGRSFKLLASDSRHSLWQTDMSPKILPLGRLE